MSGAVVRRDAVRERLTDMACALVLAYGACLLAFAALRYESAWWVTLLICAASMVLVGFFALRWWIFPAFAAAGGIALATLALVPEYAEGWRVVSGFFSWTVGRLPEQELFDPDLGIFILECTIALVASAVFYLVMRRLFFFPAISGLSAAGVIALYAAGFDELFAGTLVLVSGCLALMPRMFHRYLQKNQGGMGGIPRHAMQWIGVLMAALALVGAVLVTPEDTSLWRSHLLGNITADVRDFFNLRQGKVQGRYTFSLRSSGFQPESERLGGPASINDRDVLIVNTDTPLPLRGSVMDYYSGEGWGDQYYDGQFRLDSWIWSGRRDEAYPMGGDFLTGEAQGLYNNILTREASFEVMLRGVDSSTYFIAGAPQSFQTGERNLDFDPYFDMQGECFMTGWPEYNMTYSFASLAFDRSRPGFDRAMAEVTDQVRPGSDHYFEGIQRRYTQLPDDLPDVVRETAAMAAQGAATPYEAARAIENWLGANFTYTLEPETPPEGSDFVAYFLESREGYCTYYASAMTVMARSLDIPARYVVGFVMPQKVSGRYYVTNEQAHAWSEIYIEGVGWIPFDPLGWAPGAGEAQTPIYNGPGYSEEDGEIALPEFEQIGDSLSGIIALFLIVGTPVALIVFGLVFYFLLVGRHRRRFTPEALGRKYPEAVARYDFLFADLLRQLSAMEVDMHKGETLSGFSERVDRRVLAGGHTMAGILPAAERWYYGGIPPAMEDLAALSRYHGAVEEQMALTMGKMAYFWRRVVLGRRGISRKRPLHEPVA